MAIIAKTKNTENDKRALLKPPKKTTKLPTKKTAVAVKNRAILKQKPVADARILTGNKAGI